MAPGKPNKSNWAKATRIPFNEDPPNGAAVVPIIPLLKYEETVQHNAPGVSSSVQSRPRSTQRQTRTTATPNIPWGNPSRNSHNEDWENNVVVAYIPTAEYAETFKENTPGFASYGNGQSSSKSQGLSAITPGSTWGRHTQEWRSASTVFVRNGQSSTAARSLPVDSPNSTLAETAQTSRSTPSSLPTSSRKKRKKRYAYSLETTTQIGQSNIVTHSSDVVVPNIIAQTTRNGTSDTSRAPNYSHWHQPVTRSTQNRQSSATTSPVLNSNMTWAQASPNGHPTTPKSSPNQQVVFGSSEKPAAEVEEHWDTHDIYADAGMTDAQIVIAKAADAVKAKAKAKKDAMEVKLQGWPWKGAPRRLITAGPLYLNTWHGNNLTKTFHDQPGNKLIQALQISGVGELIIDLLFQNHATIWKLAYCCQKAHSIVKNTLDFWDMNIGHFNGCDKPPTDHEDKRGSGLVAANLVVAPLRAPTVEQLHAANTFYESQLWNTYALCQAVQYRSTNFRRVHLHRVPFLTTRLLEVLIPQMSKLEVLGIYKCPLIHIGNGMDLLHTIKMDRPKGREFQVKLDWYPNFHVGPVEVKGSPYTKGGYGATWDDWYAETDRAIWAIVIPFLGKCKQHGIDAISSYTQFRQWLQAGPCWDVTNTLKAIVSAYNLHVPGIDLFDGDNVDFTTFVPEEVFPSRRLQNPVPKTHYFTKFPKLTRAVVQMDIRNPQHNGNYDQFFHDSRQLKHSRPEGYEWRFKPLRCMTCSNPLPGICYQFYDIKVYLESTNYGANPDSGSDLQCLGCSLTHYLNTEKDHFKEDKRTLVDFWLTDGIDADGQKAYNTNDINKLIEDFGSKNMIKWVKMLDGNRLARTKEYGFDREFHDIQMDLTPQVKRSKRGNFLGAPQIGEWVKYLAEKEDKITNPERYKWRSGERTSYLLGVRTHG